MLKDRIKEARKSAGLSQEQLAKRLGTAQRTISGYEKGENDPQVGAVVKIANICSLSSTWLLTGEGSPQGGVAEDSSPYAGGFSAGSERYFEKIGGPDIDKAGASNVSLSESKTALEGGMSLLDYKDLVQFQREKITKQNDEIAELKAENKALRENKREAQ